jgi:hypothetical protein
MAGEGAQGSSVDLYGENAADLPAVRRKESNCSPHFCRLKAGRAW